MGTGRRSRQRAVGAAALPEPGGRARLGRVPGPVVPPAGGSSSPGGAGGGGRGPRFRPGSVPTAGLAPTGSAGPALRDTARRHGGAVCLLSPAHRAAACAQLKAAGVGTCRSWRKGIETSRLVLIVFHLLREYVIFVWVCRDFPNLFCKSQMIQCSLVYVRIYNKAYDKVFLEINKNAFPRKQFIYGKMQVT